MLTIPMLINECNYGYYKKGGLTFVIPEGVICYMKEHAESHRKFCSWLTSIGDDLVVRTFAYRKRARTELEWTEVERKTPCLPMAARKNMYLTQMSGYVPVFEPKTHASGNWYGYTYYNFEAKDFDVWSTENIAGLTSHIINIEYLSQMDKYKYCGYSGNDDLIKYIREYEKEPKVEYFGKLGIPVSKLLINKLKKDKQFPRFLMDNVEDVKKYGPQATAYAYDNNMGIADASEYLSLKRKAEKFTSSYFNIKTSGVDRIKLFNWIVAHDIGWRNYADYFQAISVLGYDLTDTKNIYPKDFQRMHDLRINEYASYKAKIDKKKKRELCKQFSQVAKKFMDMEQHEGAYAIIIAKSPSQLVNEGTKLHHCVGRMGYDKKMANGESLIFFVRQQGNLDKPFVTLEYSLKNHMILQCYADHDSRPSAEVIDFTNEWSKRVTKKLLKQG